MSKTIIISTLWPPGVSKGRLSLQSLPGFVLFITHVQEVTTHRKYTITVQYFCRKLPFSEYFKILWNAAVYHQICTCNKISYVMHIALSCDFCLGMIRVFLYACDACSKPIWASRNTTNIKIWTYLRVAHRLQSNKPRFHWAVQFGWHSTSLFPFPLLKRVPSNCTGLILVILSLGYQAVPKDPKRAELHTLQSVDCKQAKNCF